MKLSALSSDAGFVRDLAPWGWFITLTFAEDVTREHARWALRTWVRVIAREVVHGHVMMTWGIERTSWDRIHIHVLLHCIENAPLFRPRFARA